MMACDDRVAKGRALVHEAIAHRLERRFRRSLAPVPIKDGDTDLALTGRPVEDPAHVQRVLALDGGSLSPADPYGGVLDLDSLRDTPDLDNLGRDSLGDTFNLDSLGAHLDMVPFQWMHGDRVLRIQRNFK